MKQEIKDPADSSRPRGAAATIRCSDPGSCETPASTQRRAFWLPSRGRPGYSCGTAPASHRTSPISASPLQTRPSAAHSVVKAHYHAVLRSSTTRVQLCTAGDHDRIVRRLLARCEAEDDARAVAVCLSEARTALIGRALVIHAGSCTRCRLANSR